MQRLFSTFADGWPGIGLLLLRLLTGLALIRFAILGLRQAPPFTTAVLLVIGAGAGLLLLAGLWTPVAGSLAAIVNVWIALSQFLSHSDDLWIAVIKAVLGAALAMIEPGAWSLMPGFSVGSTSIR